jgi:superfamily II DNA/RNA helicase
MKARIFNGVHISTATPGRLRDMLIRRDLNLDICRYLNISTHLW